MHSLLKMKKTSYIIVIQNFYIPIEGWTSCQYHGLNPLMRTICWLVGLFHAYRFKYPKSTHMFQCYPKFQHPSANYRGILTFKN